MCEDLLRTGSRRGIEVGVGEGRECQCKNHSFQQSFSPLLETRQMYGSISKGSDEILRRIGSSFRWYVVDPLAFDLIGSFFDRNPAGAPRI
jgi:hypothetical protein